MILRHIFALINWVHENIRTSTVAQQLVQSANLCKVVQYNKPLLINVCNTVTIVQKLAFHLRNDGRKKISAS